MKVRYVVGCAKHGQESSDWAGKQVVVSKPRNGKDRKEGGCPYCKTAARAELAETPLGAS